MTSAILSGSALVALVALAARRFDRLQLPEATWSTVRKLIVTLIAVDLFLVAADYITILWGNVPRERAALNMILPGGSWQWVFWLEWIVGGVVPFALLTMRRWRERPAALGAAAALVLVGVYAFRVELVVGGLLKPLLSFAPGVSLGSFTAGASSFQLVGSYHPTWVEYSIVVGLMAFLSLLITLGYRWLKSLSPAQGSDERHRSHRRLGGPPTRAAVEPADRRGDRRLAGAVGDRGGLRRGARPLARRDRAPARRAGSLRSRVAVRRLAADARRPGRPPCLPYESAWTGSEMAQREDGILMSAAADEVEEIYRSLGLEVGADAHELPDHLVVELEAVAYALAHDHDEAAMQLLRMHLARWVGPFCATVANEAQQRFYAV